MRALDAIAIVAYLFVMLLIALTGGPAHGRELAAPICTQVPPTPKPCVTMTPTLTPKPTKTPTPTPSCGPVGHCNFAPNRTCRVDADCPPTQLPGGAHCLVTPCTPTPGPPMPRPSHK